MSKGHWSRLRAAGGGPRGGSGGHAKGPLRKVVRNRKVYTIVALPHGKAHWSDWQTLLETEDYFQARDRLREEMEDCGAERKWNDVRFSEGGWEEVLECGHSQPPVCDLIGETNAVRRRCWRCKRGQ